jgi:hypothetical protein
MSKVIPITGEFASGAQVIQEAEVTVERLRSLLETAVIDVEFDEEGDLYLTGGIDFPMWVCVDPDRFSGALREAIEELRDLLTGEE